MSIQQLKQYCDANNIRYSENMSMATYTSFKIGGPADLVAMPSSISQIASLLTTARQANVPVTVIGKGSNLLVSDDGIRGLALSISDDFAQIEQREDYRLYCQAGASLSKICRFASKHGLAGLEFAYGIPGSLGGAVIMNAGAYDGEIKDVIVHVDHLDDDVKPGAFTAEEAQFAYRHSVYADNRYCVTGALLQLHPGDPDAIRATMDEILEKRKAKQPLDYPSAGSTFKRPQGNFASALIDQCGLKGKTVGGAMVSQKHAGFIINCHNATCADVKSLIAQVQEEVEKQTGYRLECEVKLI